LTEGRKANNRNAFMIADQTTLQDLSIFHAEHDQSVWNALNYTRTNGGAVWLEHLLRHPFSDRTQILDTQEFLQMIVAHHANWPTTITNGTIMVLQRYYESQVDTIPNNAGLLDGFSYKLFHTHDYSLTRYTVGHAIDFFQGFTDIIRQLGIEKSNRIWNGMVLQATQLMKRPEIREMIAVKNKSKLRPHTLLRFGHFLLYRFKDALNELIELYSRIDAYYSLATATIERNLQFPAFTENDEPYIEASGLSHILLTHPVPYEIHLNQHTNFIFLTGANMAGKSTFIKAVGVAVYLAHIGMAVPAQSMTLSVFHGLLSNIQVQDNIVKGESYFFNEVQRIKNTIIRINNGQQWLVLIDELFKGTNVQDAMRCSAVVIRGLLKINRSLFILSTHLYEIGEDLKAFPNVAFRYFETGVADGELQFSYQLREGISNDRLGYLILKKEGVVDLIDKL
jgi:DNA mismatch repair ATPase MutS